ncbi:BfmA/BtgA family mobilization protein [Arenibacter sp. F20364]|uniref:BfmA/BtgA family mobilization protein n=1 Tax=Arenibacter sp. F20364 TaxID=2926415 RepID=UPI001FF160AA|nr:BfmA/BtgA family mobilization protein [Arenibacter sp. F20364]MCK0192963.1 hypothetical protein [Arenibacter sp. F20364]
MSNERASVKIYSDAKNNLAILAKRSGKSEIDYLSKGIDFIYQSGIDVYAKTLPNVPDLIKNLENRIIGFMKKREQDFFVPMNKRVHSLVEHHMKLTDQLEAFDVINFAMEQADKEADKKEDKYIVTEGEPLPKVAEETTTLERVQIAKNEAYGDLKGQLEKSEAQRLIFREQLDFLFKRLAKSGAMTGGKFTANINQRDYDRIEKILHDN